jgi:hypothetical protein
MWYWLLRKIPVISNRATKNQFHLLVEQWEGVNITEPRIRYPWHSDRTRPRFQGRVVCCKNVRKERTIASSRKRYNDVELASPRILEKFLELFQLDNRLRWRVWLYEHTGAQVFTGVMVDDAVETVTRSFQLTRSELLYSHRVSIMNTLQQHNRTRSLTYSYGKVCSCPVGGIFNKKTPEDDCFTIP